MLGARRHKSESSHESSLFNSSSDDEYAGDVLTGEPQLDIDEFFAKIGVANGLLADLKIDQTKGTDLNKNKESLIDLDAVSLKCAEENDSLSDERKWLKRLAEPDSSDNIVYDSETPSFILAARKEKLIALLTSDAGKEFTENFLMTFHLFMSSEELASIIGVRLRSAYMADTQANQKIRLVTFRLIKSWCVEYLEDEKSLVVIEVRKILNEAVNRVWEDAVMLTMSDKQLLMNLGNVLEGRQKENVIVESNTTHKPVEGDGWLKRSFSNLFSEQVQRSSLPKDYEVFLMERSTDIAEQLSLLEEQVFCEVDWRDLLDLIQSSKSTAAEQNSLQRAVFHFNGMCRWFVSEVCRSPSMSTQAEKIKKLVKTGYKCMKHGNLSTAVQVSLALQNHSVQELKEVWSRLPKKTMGLFEELTILSSPRQNFSAVRKTVELLVGSPTVPFLGIFIADMKALAEAPNDYPTELVPWHKFQVAAKILRRFRELQDKSAGYRFIKNLELYAFVSDPSRYSTPANKTAFS